MKSMKSLSSLAALALVCGALVFALPLEAQEAQNQPPAKNIALAEQLVSLMHLEQNLGLGMGKMKDVQGKIASSLLTNSSPATMSFLQKTMDASMHEASSMMNWETMKPIFVNAYASVYSPEELQGAIDFYKSPIGQKWVEKQPQVSEIIMAKTMELTMAAQKPMMDSLKKSMNALDALRKGLSTLTNSPTN